MNFYENGYFKCVLCSIKLKMFTLSTLNNHFYIQNFIFKTFPCTYKTKYNSFDLNSTN